MPVRAHWKIAQNKYFTSNLDTPIVYFYTKWRNFEHFKLLPFCLAALANFLPTALISSPKGEISPNPVKVVYLPTLVQLRPYWATTYLEAPHRNRSSFIGLVGSFSWGASIVMQKHHKNLFEFSVELYRLKFYKIIPEETFNVLVKIVWSCIDK